MFKDKDTFIAREERYNVEQVNFTCTRVVVDEGFWI